MRSMILNLLCVITISSYLHVHPAAARESRLRYSKMKSAEERTLYSGVHCILKDDLCTI